MGRPKKEEYWNQVTIEENGAWKCKYCRRKFKGGASRIEAHVEQIQGKGIEVCKGSINCDPQEAVNAMNPVEVAEAGHDMIDANIGGSMEHQFNTESINLLGVAEGGHETVDANVGCSIGHQTNNEYLLGGSAEPVHAVTQSDNNAFESEINLSNELLHDLTCEEDDIKGQLEWLECRGKKRKRQVDVWLNKVQELKSKIVYMKNPFDQQGLFEHYGVGLNMQQLIGEVKKHKEQKPLVLSNELVGESFERNVKKMWELLGDDQVFIIGIHGMGGVGKTCLAAHMENEIKRKGAFEHVFWVTISHNYSIFKLQQDIAERVCVKLKHEDERTRAIELSLALETQEKLVLILDDVWETIDFQKVGIPLKVNGLKLIFTSRLEHVCYQMDCPHNNIIRMEPFSENEGLELFLLKLGHYGTPATLPPKVIEIAKSIARECDGLPLGISVMAKTMKGINDIHRWRHALNKLQHLAKGEVLEEVLKVLKLSYDNLKEDDMRNCFLHCALYHESQTANLIMMLVEDGMINGTGSLNEIFDEGRTILDELKGHSLLLGNSHYLEMHGLVKKMARHILKQSHRYLVECNKKLTDMPHMQGWTANLEVVSLNKIEEISSGTSPYCPRLSTLILSYNSISRIPECFFAHMNALAILDLSRNYNLTSLPDSLSNLTSLVSLVLTRCFELKYVPPLGSLQALSRLDISHTSVKEVQGLEMLTNLKWLDLSLSELMLIPGFVLPSLINLQYLDLRCAGSIELKAEDVQGMTRLECFGVRFDDCQNYNNYVQKLRSSGDALKTYHLHSGITSYKLGLARFVSVLVPEYHELKLVQFGDCEESLHWLPNDLADLFVSGNTHWISLCCSLSSNGPSSLRDIHLYCTKLESLFCLFGNCSLCTNLKNLESLILSELTSLTVICKEDVVDRTQAVSPNGVFSHLRYFEICGCNRIESLLTPGLLPQLQNLETISVERCKSVREIFRVRSSDGDDDASSITLPKLSRLELVDLPRLKTVCKGIIVCESLPILEIRQCDNLESFPTIQVSL